MITVEELSCLYRRINRAREKGSQTGKSVKKKSPDSQDGGKGFFERRIM